MPKRNNQSNRKSARENKGVPPVRMKDYEMETPPETKTETDFSSTPMLSQMSLNRIFTGEESRIQNSRTFNDTTAEIVDDITVVPKNQTIVDNGQNALMVELVKQMSAAVVNAIQVSNNELQSQMKFMVDRMDRSDRQLLELKNVNVNTISAVQALEQDEMVHILNEEQPKTRSVVFNSFVDLVPNMQTGLKPTNREHLNVNCEGRNRLHKEQSVKSACENQNVVELCDDTSSHKYDSKSSVLPIKKRPTRPQIPPPTMNHNQLQSNDQMSSHNYLPSMSHRLHSFDQMPPHVTNHRQLQSNDQMSSHNYISSMSRQLQSNDQMSSHNYISSMNHQLQSNDQMSSHNYLPSMGHRLHSYDQMPPHVINHHQLQSDDQMPSYYRSPTCILQSNEVPQNHQPQSNNQLPANPRLLPNTMKNNSVQVKRKLHDLPIFNGQPEEWPLFITTFRETTIAYEYTELENLIRLQKSLQGKARQVVEAMLIHPNNIPTIMEELEFRFGRTELMIKSQLEKIKKIPRIAEDNFTQLIEFSSKVRNFVAYMRSANAEYQLHNPQLIEELVAKLPNVRRIEWAYHIRQIVPRNHTVDIFADWLHDVARVVSLIECTGDIRVNNEKKALKNGKNYTLHTTTNRSEHIIKCKYCGESHVVQSCPKFLKLKINERWAWVKENTACFSCLNTGHRVFDCRNKKICSIEECKMRHHPLLHEVRVPAQPEASESKTPLAPVLINVNRPKAHVYFKVAAVTVFGSDSKKINTFALIDDASSITIMESSLARDLNLTTSESESIELSWLDSTSIERCTKIVNCEIQGKSQGCEKLQLRRVHLMDNLSLPCQSMDLNEMINQYPQLSGLPLKHRSNAKPRILIGLNNAHIGKVLSYVECSPSSLIAVQTPLGWLMYGSDDRVAYVEGASKQPVLFVDNYLKEEYEKLHETVASFYDMENFGVQKPTKNLESNDIVRAREILDNTTKQVGERYEVGLLWRSHEVVMPDSYDMALRRLNALFKKFNNDDVYAEGYRKALFDFIDKKYARKMSNDEIAVKTNKTWYLPHFGVVSPHKPGKIRIVFDAAAMVSKVSLNSQLLKGPDLGQPLLNVLSQFREGIVGVCADIKEMFCQVQIREEDRDSQRFLWKDKNIIEVYQMQSMVFGATCSPVAAQHVKNVNARKYENTCSEAVAECIVRNHYVDDFVKSFPSAVTAIQVSQQVVEIHKSAGFELRRFVSNCRAVADTLNGEKSLNNQTVDLNVESGLNTEKILGMYWNENTDEFVFQLKFHKIPIAVLKQERCPTKREMLSLAMSIFDPFGFLGNFHMNSKIMLQYTWKLPLDWDEPVPEDLSRMWYQWQSELENVKKFKIPRCFSINLPLAMDVQLHILVDASQEAYAAVSYWRLEYEAGIELSFIYGKTRVAPRKMLSIPRMELQAAVLGVRMKQAVIECHNIRPSKCFIWSDSKTVISWINSDARNYKPFVAHRVAEILEYSEACEWRWVPTLMNTADDATRLQSPVKFDLDSRWINGPEFLHLDPKLWPGLNEIVQIEADDELKKKSKHVLLVSVSENMLPISISKFSKYMRLVRSVAWCLRVVSNWLAKLKKKLKMPGELTAIELIEAENYICKMVQKVSFSEELAALHDHRPIEPTSKIYTLSPYLADDGLIRIKGRIDAASSIPFETKRPIILPQESDFTRLLIAYHHEKCRHQFDETVVCQIRQKFWIPCVRTALKKVKAKCQRCKNNRAVPAQPMMGQLPIDRITGYVRPFTFTGLDYFGPYNIVIGRSRVKRWVALFSCSTYRGVHLEVAHDLSTDACILCLRNFINIRGIPKRIRSDNGTNFVGMKGELCNVNDFFDQDQIRSELAPFGIEWLFNCPADPSAGGSWERLVQSVKRALTSTLHNRVLHEHTFRSLLLEAMNIVNSRPLTHLPVSPEDESPLTPNHYIIGEINSTHSPGTCNEKLMCLRKQWRIAQQLKNHFYQRWVSEYLPVLTRRCKWFTEVPPLSVGTLVIVCDPDMPRSKWIMGRIEDVVVAKDGQVRQATVRTSSGLIRRPAHKLAALDVEVKSTDLH